MPQSDARKMVLRAQLAHARFGLSAAADNSTMAAEWLRQVRELEGKLAKLTTEETAEAAAA
jgi:hypothetical protein